MPAPELRVHPVFRGLPVSRVCPVHKAWLDLGGLPGPPVRRARLVLRGLPDPPVHKGHKDLRV